MKRSYEKKLKICVDSFTTYQRCRAVLTIYLSIDSHNFGFCHSWPKMNVKCHVLTSFIFAVWNMPFEKLAQNRSSHQRCLVRKCVRRNFAKFTGKDLCQGLFFDKDAGFRPATLFKKRLWHRCFSVNFAKFLKTPFFIEHLWWLLLTQATCKLFFKD